MNKPATPPSFHSSTSQSSSSPPPEVQSPAAPPADLQPIRVWDPMQRLCHWTLALGFLGAWLTSESEAWRGVHVVCGSLVLAAVSARLLWGVLGSRHARFTRFVRPWPQVQRYLLSLLTGRPEHHTGHNPAGGWAVLALLGLSGTAALLGWALYQELGGHGLEEAHEWFAQLALGMVLLHLAAVAISSLLHRENLARAMLSGRKRGLPQEAIGPWRGALAAVLFIAWSAVVVGWIR